MILIEPTTPAQIEQALVRLRVELFTAAQVLKAEQLADFWKLVDDINAIRETPSEDVVQLRAQLRREQDARADLRVELDQLRALREAEVEREEAAMDDVIEERDARIEQINEIADALGDEGEWTNLHDRGDAALQQARDAVAEVESLRTENARLRTERDEARAELVKAMQTIEAGTAADPRGFAVWLLSRGWLVSVERAPVHHDINALTFVDRLSGATRYVTEDEARAALELAAEGEPVQHLSEVGVVVTL